MNVIEKIKTVFNCWADERIAKKLVHRLSLIDKREWLEIGHQFNRWEFPVKFYDLIPSWYHGSASMARLSKIISPVCNVIHNNFTSKEQLRYHNVYKGKMTNEEFDYWFDNFSTHGANRYDNSFHTYYMRKQKITDIQFWKDDVWQRFFPQEKSNA